MRILFIIKVVCIICSFSTLLSAQVGKDALDASKTATSKDSNVQAENSDVVSSAHTLNDPKAKSKTTEGKKIYGKKTCLKTPQIESCSGCKQPNELTYDFRCKRFFYNDSSVYDPRDVKVWNNKEFKVRVVNVNRYMYNVGVTADNVLFQSAQPALFKELALGEGTLITSLIAKLKESEGLSLQIAGNAKAGENFKKKLTEFLKKYYKLMGSQLKAYNYCTEELPICDANRKPDFESFANLFLDLKLEYASFLSGVQRELDSAKSNVTVSNAALTACKNDPKKPKCDTIEKQLEKHKATQTSLEQLIAQMNKIWETVSKIGESDLMRHVLFSNNLVGDHMFFYSPPIFPKGNKLAIKLSFNASDSSLIRKWNIMPLYNDSVEIELTVLGKWFVSFSSGPFVAFGSGLIDESYGVTRKATNNVVTDTSSYGIVPLEGNPVLPGIGAFANLGLKRNGFGFGFTPGVGITIEKQPRPVYFFGLSTYLGEKNQINFTLGGALTPVARLKTELYNENALYKSSPDIQYRRDLKAGLFVSINYTFYSYATTRSGSGRSRSK